MGHFRFMGHMYNSIVSSDLIPRLQTVNCTVIGLGKKSTHCIVSPCNVSAS